MVLPSRNHWLWIISAAFWCLHLLSRFSSTREHLERWLGYQLTVFQLGDRRFSWEVIWSFVHISKILWSPKLPWRNFLLYFWFFGPFPRPLSFLSLRTAFVPFLNLFLYIQRNNFQENCEILLPFCFQYVCDLRSLKEKKSMIGSGQHLPRFQCSGGETLPFKTLTKYLKSDTLTETLTSNLFSIWKK